MQVAGAMCVAIWIVLNVVEHYKEKKPLLPMWTAIAGFFTGLASSAIANHYGLLTTW